MLHHFVVCDVGRNASAQYQGMCVTAAMECKGDIVLGQCSKFITLLAPLVKQPKTQCATFALGNLVNPTHPIDIFPVWMVTYSLATS